MKILYAVQGTGNGHLIRAMEVLPFLKRHAKVDVLISGTQSTLKFPFEVKYHFNGMSFVFGRDGDIDYWETFRLLDTRRFLQSMLTLPVENYNLVINDFEPISAWSSRLKEVPCVSLSHQHAVLNPNVPQPFLKDPIACSFLKYYAPCDSGYGFHFQSYDDKVFTPIIRKEVRQTRIRAGAHITVYLPAYSDDKLYRKFSRYPDVEWHVFSKHVKRKEVRMNVRYYPVDRDRFIQSMASAAGVICGGGFETPSEALYLNKKLLIVPMKGQFEQTCNAYALEKMGVSVIKNLKEKRMHMVDDWLEQAYVPRVEYPDQTEDIVINILDNYEHRR